MAAVHSLGPQFQSMAQVKQANKDAGQHWFDPSTTRFFGSRVGGQLHSGPGGQFFVSSERQPASYYPEYRPLGERGYTVRKVNPDASIDTHGDFQGHPTRRRALTAARRAAQGS